MAEQIPQSKCTVERCYKISLKDFGKGLLAGKTGKFEIYRGLYNKRKCAFRSIPYEPIRVQIAYEFGDRIYKQNIYLETEDITFGKRPYLLCGCGHRANTLYLRPDFPLYFACRDCLHLDYELSHINRNILGGELIYRNNRLLKIEEAKMKMKKTNWRGKITKDMIRIGKMYGKWCFDKGALEKVQFQLSKIKNTQKQKLNQSF